jgi:hypothetical protein
MTSPEDAEQAPVAILRIDAGYQALLRAMLDDLGELIEDPGAAGPDVARRLVPDAHPDDPLAEDDYRAVVGSQLREERLEALDTMRRGLESAAAEGPSSADAAEAAELLFSEVAALGGDAGFGSRLEVLRDVWYSADAEGPVRGRVVEELVRLCLDGAKDAARRGDEEAESAWLAAAGRAEWLPLAAGAVEVHLTADELEAWLKSVNHVRLALGTICGITDDDDDWDPGDARSPLIERYHLLTALLAHLVDLVP